MKTWDEMSPRERDALVATEAMNWDFTLRPHDWEELDVEDVETFGSWLRCRRCYELPGWTDDERAREGECHAPVPPYTTSIAAAWKVVEKADKEGFSFILTHGDDAPTVATFVPHNEKYRSDGSHMHMGEADHPAEAICLAALRAKKVGL